MKEKEKKKFLYCIQIENPIENSMFYDLYTIHGGIKDLESCMVFMLDFFS